MTHSVNYTDTYSNLSIQNTPFQHTNSSSINKTCLAEEAALAISYNGINYAVTMLSPANLIDFIIGFSLTNQVVKSLDHIYDIHISEGLNDSIMAQVTISQRAFWAMKQKRQLPSTSSCGVCGVESLEQAMLFVPALKGAILPPEEHFISLRQQITDVQIYAKNSGALHAALFVDQKGTIVLCREDVGRHNALDKLIGALWQSTITKENGFAITTSRCSFELIQKIVYAQITTLISLSAPTTLAVKRAQQYNLNLIHLTQHSAPRIFNTAQV